MCPPGALLLLMCHSLFCPQFHSFTNITVVVLGYHYLHCCCINAVVCIIVTWSWLLLCCWHSGRYCCCVVGAVVRAVAVFLVQWSARLLNVPWLLLSCCMVQRCCCLCCDAYSPFPTCLWSGQKVNVTKAGVFGKKK